MAQILLYGECTKLLFLNDRVPLVEFGQESVWMVHSSNELIILAFFSRDNRVNDYCRQFSLHTTTNPIFICQTKTALILTTVSSVLEVEGMRIFLS